MDTKPFEVADLFRRFGELFRSKWPISDLQRRVMRAIEDCRTAVLGGHVYRCQSCSAEKIRYNSCRNRHCPKCQSLDKEKWLEARGRDLLPVPYFHVVFTLPHELHDIALRNPRALYNWLFRAAAETLLAVGDDPRRLGARIGFLAVLHTWSSTLTLHPHLHCIVQGGGLAPDGSFRTCGKKFFAPVRVLGALFRGKFLDFLEQGYRRGEVDLTGLPEMEHPVLFRDLLDRLRGKKWVVFSKRPFAGPEQVLSYLARYTHRVAISNQRLIGIEGEDVIFRYKNYRAGGKQREMRLHATEFIRRFLLHVLPERFVRIRYYGMLAHRGRRENLEQARHLLGVAAPEAPPAEEAWPERMLRVTGVDPMACTACGEGVLVMVMELPRRGAPPDSRGPP